MFWGLDQWFPECSSYKSINSHRACGNQFAAGIIFVLTVCSVGKITLWVNHSLRNFEIQIWYTGANCLGNTSLGMPGQASHLLTDRRIYQAVLIPWEFYTQGVPFDSVLYERKCSVVYNTQGKDPTFSHKLVSNQLEEPIKKEEWCPACKEHRFAPTSIYLSSPWGQLDQTSRWKGERQKYKLPLGSAAFPIAISFGLHGGAGSCCTSLTGCASNTLSGDQAGEKAETKTCIARSQGPSLLLKEGLKMF